MTIGFTVERIDSVSVAGPDEFLSKELMSPYVWQEPDDARLHMLVRAVPPNEDAQKRDSGHIWYGRSGSDGTLFQMHGAAVLVPGETGNDVRGCE